MVIVPCTSKDRKHQVIGYCIDVQLRKKCGLFDDIHGPVAEFYSAAVAQNDCLEAFFSCFYATRWHFGQYFVWE